VAWLRGLASPPAGPSAVGENPIPSPAHVASSC